MYAVRVAFEVPVFLHRGCYPQNYPQLQHCSSIQSMNGMLMKSIGDNMTINEEIEKVRAEILKEALEITPKCYVENGDVVVDIKAFRKLVEWQSRYNSDTIHINIVHILENENTANIKIFKGYGDDILKLIEKSKLSEKIYEWAKPIYNRFREVTQQGCLESVTWILNLHFGDVVFGKELLEEIKDMEIFYDSEQKAIEEYAEVVRASRIIKDEPSLIRTTFQSILHRGEYCGKALVRMLNAVLRQADK